MTNVTLATFDFNQAPLQYCRVIFTEEASNRHRFVETNEGHLEYRLGVGKYKDIDARGFRTLVRTVIQSAKSHQIEKVALSFHYDQFPKLALYDESWFASTIVENILLASYEYTRYKTKDTKNKKLSEVTLCGFKTQKLKHGFARGQVVGTYTNKARDIANTPGRDMTPSELAKAAKKLMDGTKVMVNVLGEKELKKLGMGALLAVGQGTKQETKFIIAEYWGAGKPSGKTSGASKKPIVLIGKGITYDTGGLNVKPSGSMHDMHLDMSGGSSVLGALAAAAKLGMKKNIVALVPTAENAISDDAMRAGDIVTSMSGQTIEVVHTDAEGRMILADALTYSSRYNPRVIIDVATLTGAALVALGQHASAVLSKDDALIDTLRTLSEEAGDLVWPLPLWDEYKQHIKSARADIANIAPNFSRYGGTIEGATFLTHFAPKNVPWAHLDIAPRMEASASDKLAKGSTGEPVRLLVKFLETA
jgi:leucyl aminopeptidase